MKRLLLAMRGGRARRSALACLSLIAVCSQSIAATGVDESAIYGLPPVIDDQLAPAAHYSAYLYDDSADADEGDLELTMEDRMKAIEGKYDDLSEDYDALSGKYDELKSKMKNAAFAGHSDATMKVNGRIHADIWGFPGTSPGVNAFESGSPDISPQDRFGFRRLRFGVKGDIWQNMLYKVEMEFAGGNKSEFRDAYLGWKDLPIFREVLLGNQKRPYGLDHLNSSRFNVFMERPFIIEGDNQDARRFGLCSYGYSEDEAWNWRFGTFNQQLIQSTGNYVSDSWQMEFAGRLANTWWYDESSGGRGYGHWAVSGAYANPGGGAPGQAPNQAQFQTRPEARSSSRWLDTGTIVGARDYELLGLENVWNFGPLQITGEYQNVWLQRQGNTDLNFYGAYVYVAYFLTGEHMPWDRESGTLDRIYPFENFFLVDTCRDGVRGGWGAWQVAYRWSYADYTDQDIMGGVGESHTVGLNWYWNAYSRMQFNCGYGDIDEHAPVAGFSSGHYTYLGTRFMVDF